MGGMSLIELSQFESWPKAARLNRDIIVTEKIDGTNSAVVVVDLTEGHPAAPGPFFVVTSTGYALAAQSRTRFVTPGKDTDNHGFASWVRENAEALSALGPGRHFGEWWGKGIQRGYGIAGKRFSLFNTERWGVERPTCCEVVPVLYQGPYSQHAIAGCMTTLRGTPNRDGPLHGGSIAAPGFMNPEGVVVYHTAARQMFKWTFVGDEAGKSTAKEVAA